MTALSVRMPFPQATRRGGTLGSAAVLLMYAAVYLKDWGSQWFNSKAAMALLAVAMLAGVTALLASGAHARPISRRSWLMLAAAVVAWVMTLATTGLNTSSYYVAIPCAFIVVNTDPRLFTRLLLFHLALTLVLAAFEYLAGSYFFIYQADDGTALDERLFGGGNDVFRAKGMFQGPLSAVAFAMWVAFLMRGSLVAAACLFFCAFFASGRLGMLTSATLIAARQYWQNGASRGVLRWVLIGGLGLSALLLFTYADETRVAFISSALDLQSDQNVSRIYFWLTSLNYYLSYGPVEQLFGSYGFILQQEGGTENDFLRLLLDCGIAGFGIYLAALGALVFRAARTRDREGLMVALMIPLLMNIFPFIQSLSSTLLFWVYYFALMDRPAGNAVRATP